MWIEITLITLTIVVLWLNLRRPANYPPGYWGLPLVGYIPIFSKTPPDEQLKELNRKHGNVTSWRIGSKLFVFIFDYKLIKEAFTGLEFIDRPSVKVLTLLHKTNTLGVVSSNGIHWQNLRRFSLRHLRDLGMGKSRLVDAIHREASEMVKDLKKSEGKPAPIPKAVVVSVLNVIWQMIASKRYDTDDEDLKHYQGLVETFIINSARIMISDIFPWLSYVLPAFLMKKLTKEELSNEVAEKLQGFLKICIDEHIESLDKENPRDFIDAYLIEMDNQKDDPLSTMSLDDLTYTIADFFTAGSETTSTTLHWTFYYLASFPEVQRKLQKEVDEVLPKGTAATLEDKARLPYAEAFINEVLRYSSFASVGGVHTTVQDTKLGGYLIPKGAFIFASAITCHNNPEYFDSPNEFRPERFLDSNGKLSISKDGFLAFGIGRRQCLGESLARMELFIFTTYLVQHLNFSAPPDKKIDLDPVESNPLSRFPKDQEIVITSR